MRGTYFTDDGSLPEGELNDLADVLAAQLFTTLERKVYGLSKADVAEIIQPYVDDLQEGDQRSVAWLVWDLFQEGLKMEMKRRNRKRRLI